MHEVDGGKTIRIILRGCELLMGNGILTEPDALVWGVLSLCKRMDMTPIGEPIVRRIPPGLSCGLVIAESHIFLHTWPETASVRAVIDCCVDFDHDLAAEWLRTIFGAKRYEYSIARRYGMPNASDQGRERNVPNAGDLLGTKAVLEGWHTG